MSGVGRLPTDVAGEIMDVLADEPRILRCDLNGMAVDPSADEMLAPVAGYLYHWPGTVVVLCVSDGRLRAHLQASRTAAAAGGRLLVRDDGDAAIAEARDRVAPLQRVAAQLPPLPTAARDARRLVTDTLLQWRLPQAVGPAALVVSELVTNSVVHAVTVLDLTLSRVEDRIRVAVRDHGGGRPQAHTARTAEQPGAGTPPDQPGPDQPGPDQPDADPPGLEQPPPGQRRPARVRGTTPAVSAAQESLLGGRGLLVVQAFSGAWGVLPARLAGKTVWAVLDGARLR